MGKDPELDKSTTEELEVRQMTRSSNDQRSDALNPNNAEYQASQDNRSNQMNPNNIDDEDE